MDEENKQEEDKAISNPKNKADPGASVGFVILYFTLLPVVYYFVHSASGIGNKSYPNSPSGFGAAMAEFVGVLIHSFLGWMVVICMIAAVLFKFIPSAGRGLKWTFCTTLVLIVISPLLYYSM